jgi:hypothetical protein
VSWAPRITPQSPPPCAHASLAFHPATQRLVLFGGAPTNGPMYSGTWEYDGVTWTQRQPATVPPGRAGAALVLDPLSGDLVLSGGRTDNGGAPTPPARDAWRWNGTTWAATGPQAIHAVPWRCAAADADTR